MGACASDLCADVIVYIHVGSKLAIVYSSTCMYVYIVWYICIRICIGPIALHASSHNPTVGTYKLNNNYIIK